MYIPVAKVNYWSKTRYCNVQVNSTLGLQFIVFWSVLTCHIYPNMLSGDEQNKTYLSFGFSVTHHFSHATNSYYTSSDSYTKKYFRVGKFGMCAKVFLQRFQKITHLPVNILNFLKVASIIRLRELLRKIIRMLNFVLSFKDLSNILSVKFNLLISIW